MKPGRVQMLKDESEVHIGLAQSLLNSSFGSHVVALPEGLSCHEEPSGKLEGRRGTPQVTQQAEFSGI